MRILFVFVAGMLVGAVIQNSIDSAYLHGAKVAAEATAKKEKEASTDESQKTEEES